MVSMAIVLRGTRETIGDHFKTTVVGSVWSHNVQVPEEGVDCDTTASLSAKRVLQQTLRRIPTAQHSHCGARCTVVAKAVKETATPAGALSGRQGQGEASKQEHAENLWLEASVWRRGAARCDLRRARAAGERRGHTAVFKKKLFASWVASRCQP